MTLSEIGPAEQGSVRFGMRLPDRGHQAPIAIGSDRGFYAEEGLDVSVVVTEDLEDQLLSGGLSLADMPSTQVLVNAGTRGVPLRLVSGWHGVRDYWIAVGSGVEAPEDLAGRRVILGAPADQPVRLKLLADAGWDMSGISFEATNPPGGSDVWVAQLVSGEAAMAPIFLRHRQAVAAAGGRLVLDVSKDWPSNSVGASRSFLEANPNTVIRFLRATVRAMAIWMDPANEDYVLDLWRREGLEVTEEHRTNYVRGFLRPYGRADLSLRESEFTDLVTGSRLLPEMPPFDSYVDERFLRAALQSLGMSGLAP